MKKAFLILSLFVSASAFATGGTSGVGPCGPDCQAQQAFEKDAVVTASLNKLAKSGFTQSVPSMDVNQFASYLNCGKPTIDATWIACDRLYVFTRTFALGTDANETRTVTAIVKQTMNGTTVEVVNGL